MVETDDKPTAIRWACTGHSMLHAMQPGPPVPCAATFLSLLCTISKFANPHGANIHD